MTRVRPPFDWPTPGEWRIAGAVVLVLTLVLLRAQASAMTSVPDLGDPLFSMWRLGWIAHQLPHDPMHLFDANIFAPAAHTLAYSDAMIVPALVAAPALWLGAPIVVVYNGLILLSFLTAALGMFALARATTGLTGVSLVAGGLYAFDPFRFAHYSHLELLVTAFMPLAILALVRTLSSGRVRDGALTGVFVALQAGSSLYYGAFVSIAIVAIAIAWMLCVARPTRRVLWSLVVAAAIPAVSAFVLTVPYRESRRVVGDRDVTQVAAFSATPRDYLVASTASVPYADHLLDRDNGERELYPGVVAPLMALGAIVPPVGWVIVPPVAGLIISVDGSLGLHGLTYRWLYDVPAFRAFRVPARFRGVASVCLVWLAAIGLARVVRRIRSAPARRIALCAVALVAAIDLMPTLHLVPVWPRGPTIYGALSDPRAVIADLPMPSGADPPWHDAAYTYFSMLDWHRSINGTSGFTPPWYAGLGRIAREFPSDASLDAFARLGTTAFVLHQSFYRDDFARVVAAAAAQPRLRFVTASSWEEGECRLYRLDR